MFKILAFALFIGFIVGFWDSHPNLKITSTPTYQPGGGI